MNLISGTFFEHSAPLTQTFNRPFFIKEMSYAIFSVSCSLMFLFIRKYAAKQQLFNYSVIYLSFLSFE